MANELLTSDLNTYTAIASAFENGSVSSGSSLSPWNVSSTTTNSFNDSNISVRPGAQGEAPFDVYLNNPYELISFEAYNVTMKLGLEYLGPILFLIGVPANILNALVFFKQGLRDRMNLCLFVLAIVDAIFVAAIFVSVVQTFMINVDFTLSTKFAAVTTVYFAFFTFGMRSASGYITMVIALERCVCVVSPLRANTLMRTRTMGLILVAIVILSPLANVILCFQYKVVHYHDEATGVMIYTNDFTDFFRANPLFVYIYYNIIVFFILPLVTFVVVAGATAVTVIKLRMAMAWRASTSSGTADNQSQQQQAALTKMLVIVCCVFIVCSAPYTFIGIIMLLVPDFNIGGLYIKFFWSYVVVSGHVLAPLNSSVNLFVYYARSSRFRAELHELFVCCRAKDKLKGKKGEESMTIVSEY